MHDLAADRSVFEALALEMGAPIFEAYKHDVVAALAEALRDVHRRRDVTELGKRNDGDARHVSSTGGGKGGEPRG